MRDELTTLRSAGYQSGTEKNVVQTGFQNLKHYCASNAFLGCSFAKYVEKLFFRNVVSPTNLLFFQQVSSILRALLAVAAVLTWRIRLSGNSTFDAAAYTGTDCPATFTSGSNVSQTSLLLSKRRQKLSNAGFSNQGSRTLAFSQHFGERTLVTAALANTRRLQCPYILADGKG